MADTHLTIDPSSPAIAPVRGDSIATEDAQVSLPLWLREIMDQTLLRIQNHRTEEPNIPKDPEPNIIEVPGELWVKKEECYSPLAVSIGPFHYSDREGKLQQVEELKDRMMLKFVEDTPRKYLYANVKEELQKARGCYPKYIRKKFSDEEFIKMMFIDGCFILQFMHCLVNESEKLEMSEQQIFHVKRDLLLLENQLPFAVLYSLRKLRKCFVPFGNSIHVSLDWSPPPEKTQPAHLLQLLYYKSMYHYSKRNHKKARPGSRGHGLYYSAKNPKKAGILFRPRWTGAITDVKFKRSVLSGKVEVPPIIIDESTESLLLNLVAYESAAALDQFWVSSYILFMDSLIDDAEDVKEMRSNGIIINYLGADHKVAKLFNGMGESLTHDTYHTYDIAAYNDVKMAINKQCESTVKRWAYEWKKTYFSNPWTFITVLAASFGLCLTATQTYYTRFPPKLDDYCKCINS
ncbi:UPF0481 protein [Salix suchowensis]|nr:UPF0481 protein [Salix suchowensis]